MKYISLCTSSRVTNGSSSPPRYWCTNSTSAARPGVIVGRYRQAGEADVLRAVLDHLAKNQRTDCLGRVLLAGRLRREPHAVVGDRIEGVRLVELRLYLAQPGGAEAAKMSGRFAFLWNTMQSRIATVVLAAWRERSTRAAQFEGFHASERAKSQCPDPPPA